MNNEILNEIAYELKVAYKNKSILTGYVIKVTPDCKLLVKYGDFTICIPRNEISLVDNTHKGMAYKLLGTKIEFILLGYDNEIQQLIGSRKSVIKPKADLMLESLKQNMVIEGVVYSIVEGSGAYVHLGNDIIAMLPLDSISNGFVDKIHNFIKEGDRVKCAVKSITLDKNGNKRIVLDKKVFEPTFKEIMKNYDLGDVVVGKITDIVSNGVYLLIDNKLTAIADLDDRNFKVGDLVRVKIVKEVPQKFRVKTLILDKVSSWI